jgi:hypothetical protein
MDDRQERIRLFANALIRYYNFPDESDAQREQWELRKRLDEGEPADDLLLGPLSKRADEAQLRATLQQLYGDDRVEELMEIRRSLLEG